MQQNPRKRRKAFTLIEIMVAAAITIIMIGLVIQITSEVLKIWNRSVGKLSANAEARVAMELLTSDLETALLVNNGQQWIRVEQEVGDDPITVGLKLFSPALDRPSDEPGNICAIAYRLAKAPAYQNASIDTYVLFRDLEGPVDTFNNLLGPNPDNSQLELTGDDFWAPSNTIYPDNYLAGNIYSFKIYVYGVDETTGEEIVLNATNGGEFVTNDIDFDGVINEDYAYGGNNSNDELPTSAEIFLTVVSDEGMSIIELFDDPEINGAGTGYADKDEVLREHAEVFKRRVYFQARPL